MIVEVNKNGIEVKYMVVWKHNLPSIGGKLIVRNKELLIKALGSTHCFIYELGLNKGDKKLVIADKALCSCNDTYSKEIGRKISLQRALHSEDGLFSYDDRKLFWDKYLSRKSVNMAISFPKAFL